MLEAYKITWLKTFEIKNRMSKEIYWKGMLMHFLLSFFPSLILTIMELEHAVVIVFYLFWLFSIFPVLSSTIQRLHDVGKSGWNLLLYYVLGCLMVGYVLLLINLTKDSEPCDNKWGRIKYPQDEKKREINPSFVDERLTEQDVKKDRLKLFFVILKILGIVVLIGIAGTILAEIEMYLAPYF